MSNEKHETVDDIVRDMRTLGRLDEKSTDKIPRSLQALGLRTYADRIEAAAKREREAGADAAQICGEIGEMIGREAACKEEVEDCNRLGNAAAMREACANIAEYAKTAVCHTEDAHLLGYLNQIERWAAAALANAGDGE